MRNTLFFLAALLFLTTACARQHQSPVPFGIKPIKTVYIWDADGHTDISLLTGLRSEAAAYLKSSGFTVSSDPYSTDAYVKITVMAAARDSDAGRAFIKARAYVIDASDNSIVYDTTYEAAASGGGFEGPEYPVAKFVSGALSEFVKAAHK